MSKQVAIFGGGIGGLSAAHELLERGYSVKIYERQQVPGGKSRSFGYEPAPDQAPVGAGQALAAPALHKQRAVQANDAPIDAADLRPGLPAEHGFRFFPGFYRHITDVMRRTPRLDGKGCVADDLVNAREVAIAREDGEVIKVPTDVIHKPWLIRRLISAIERSDTGLSYEDLTLFTSRIWQVMTSCEARRIAEYERIGWWQFIEGDGRVPLSPAFCRYFGNLTRSLVAAQPHLASTRTNGDILVQLVIDLFNPASAPDRVLNGPTNEVWIHPWIQHLKSKYENKFEYYLDVTVTRFECSVEENAIKSATIKPSIEGEVPTRIVKCDRHRAFVEPVHLDSVVIADHYISAIPVERMAPLVSKSMEKCDPNLHWLDYLKESVQWMNGIVFYLKEDVSIAEGHVIHIDPPTALTSILQAQFWKNISLINYGNGNVTATLSVDISNWEELLDEKIEIHAIPRLVWDQIKSTVNVNGEQILKDDNLQYWSLDPAIQEIHAECGSVKDKHKAKVQAVNNILKLSNSEPLLVNTIDSWRLRPYPDSRIKNFFLASDYVRTSTDLATMEGANEAARRAVNAILDYDKSRSKRARVWALRQIWFLAPFRWRDRRRFDQGRIWTDPVPWLPHIVPPLWNAARWLLMVPKHAGSAGSGRSLDIRTKPSLERESGGG